MMDPRKILSEFDAKTAASSWLDQFKNFAFKGNVIDLAVGVIIGAAFGKIVDSLVKDIIMPVVGLIMPGKHGYVGWKWVIEGKEVPYGRFLGELVNFLIVAFALFVFVVKFLGWITHKNAQQAPVITKDQELLTEIRDLLRQQTSETNPLSKSM